MLLTVWSSLFLSALRAELFTSLVQLKGLVRLEGALSRSLDSYLQERLEAPEILRKFADHVRKESEIARSDIDKYVFHPINSFQLVRRFIRHWRELESYLAKGAPNGKHFNVSKHIYPLLPLEYLKLIYYKFVKFYFT